MRFEQYRRADEAQLFGFLFHRDLNGIASGGALAGGSIDNFIADTQAVFVLFQLRAYADGLLEGHHVAVFHPGVDHRPDVAGFLHLAIAVVELVEQRLAGDFEIAEVVAVPNYAHHIDVVKRHGDFNFGGKAGIVEHPLLLLSRIRQTPEIKKVKPVEGRQQGVMLQPLRVTVDGML